MQSAYLPYIGSKEPIICPSCDNSGTLYCKGCYKVAYCSKKCQKQDRREHRDVCNLPGSEVMTNRCLVIFKDVQLVHSIILVLRYLLKDRPNPPTICIVFLLYELENYLLEVICHEPIIKESTQNKVRLIIPYDSLPKTAINAHMDYTESVDNVNSIIDTPLYDHIKGVSDGKLAIRVNNKINSDYRAGRDYELIIRNLIVKAIARTDTQEKRDAITSRRNLLPELNKPEVLVEGTSPSSSSVSNDEAIASE